MNSRPIQLICFGIFVVSSFACAELSADTIAYTNYADGEDTNTNNGWSIGIDEIGTSREVASKFSAGASGRITQIDISAGGTAFEGDTPPATEVRVVLYGDDVGNNRPGTELWSALIDVPEYADPWIIDRRFSRHLMSNSFAPEIQSVALDATAPILTEGQEYWMAVYRTEGVWAAWFRSPRLDATTSNSSRVPNQTNWFTQQSDQNGGLFRVHVVPEPNGLALLAISSSLMILFRRRSFA